MIYFSKKIKDKTKRIREKKLKRVKILKTQKERRKKIKRVNIILFFFEKIFFDMLKIKKLIKKLKNNIENKFGEVKNHKKISRRIIINSFKYFISF